MTASERDLATYDSPTSSLSDELSDAEMAFRAVSAFDRMTSQMRRAMAINAHERLAIGLLWDRGPMTMSDLGAGIPLSRAAVTTLVDRLERAGYVTRGGDDTDRRRTVVSITREGERGIEPLVMAWAGRLDGLRQEFGDDWATVRRFLAGLREMTDQFGNELARLTDTELRNFATTADAADLDEVRA